jgi:hypothetical protein
MSNFLPINLPSKCLPYEGIQPEDILVRPYTGAEEEVLAQINPVNLERNFLAVLKNVVQGIDPSRLTVGDRMYLIIWEYINSYTSNISVAQTCSHCLQNVSFPVDLMNDLGIIFLEDDYTEPHPITLPSGSDVNVRILTIKDEVDAEKMAVQGKDVFLYRLAKSIVGDEDAFILMERMKNWPAKDIARLRKFHEIDTNHGPNLVTEISCPNCEGREEVVVPFRFEFFHPTGASLGECFGEELLSVQQDSGV